MPDKDKIQITIKNNQATIHGIQNSREEKYAILAIAFNQILWGFSPLFNQIALRYSWPEVLLAARFLLAFLFMTLLIATGKVRVSFKGKKAGLLILLAFFEVSYYYLESYGIVYTNATFSGLIMSLTPVVSVVIAALFLHEYPTRRQAFFCVLPVIGVILMTISGSSLGIIHPFGVVLLILACVAAAAFKPANRKASESFTSFERNYVVLFFSVIAYTTSALVRAEGSFMDFMRPFIYPGFIFPVLILGLGCSVGANMLANYAAGKMSVVKLAAFGPLTTLCTVFSGVIFLGEPVTKTMLFGAILIMFGIYQVSKR